MILKHIGLLLLAFIIQSTVVENLSIQDIKPDFIIIILIYVSLSSGSLVGVILGFSVGLVQDFYGPPDNLGLNALCKTLVGFGVGIAKEGLYKDSLFVLIITIGGSFLAHDGLYHIINSSFSIEHALSQFISISWLSAVYTIFASVVLIVLFTYRRGQINARRLFPE